MAKESVEDPRVAVLREIGQRLYVELRRATNAEPETVSVDEMRLLQANPSEAKEN